MKVFSDRDTITRCDALVLSPRVGTGFASLGLTFGPKLAIVLTLYSKEVWRKREKEDCPNFWSWITTIVLS
jgi:hypothetical protein